MKLKAALIAAVLATASATSAGSADFTAPPSADLGRLAQTQLVQDLDDCQLPHYYACLRFTGDPGYCYNAVQSYACP